MPRILLLCFIHGFKGNDDTFHEFPYDLKKQVARELPDHKIESAVYPTYETKGELAQASQALLEWLKERVMDVRKQHLEKPWPPHDREVGVVLVAHSMGGFVAADTLFLALNERADNGSDDQPLFPLIQGILTFDTPFNGLARSMFVYGAFSNYQKVSSVFNVMTALGAAAPAGLSRLTAQRAATSGAMSAAPRSSPGWKTWQLVAVKTGTVGAIAAGGVAAYTHRESIMKGVQNMRNINKETVTEGYRQSMETLGQGLAYINRGSVGHSFEWLSDHFAFVGALLKPKELSRRLERMGALKGVGLQDFYVSLGENGYWSGGYFVPERTFCAVPAEDHPSNTHFTRHVMREFEDEVEAHMSMFRPEKNKAYERMTDEAGELVKKWFFSEEHIFDDLKFRETPPEEAAEDSKVEETLKEQASEKQAEEVTDDKATKDDGDSLPDESPIDIAAAASMIPLPEDGNGDLVTSTDAENADVNERKRTYRQYLFSVAQQTGTGAKAWWPSMPNMPQMPNVGMPSMPQVPSAVSSLGQVSMPSMNIFGKKKAEGEGDATEKTQEVAEPTSTDADGGEKMQGVQEAEPSADGTTSTEASASAETSALAGTTENNDTKA